MSIKSEDGTEYVTTKEAAEILGVTRQTIGRLRKIGKLPKYKYRSQILTKLDDLDQLMAADYNEDIIKL